MRGIRGRYAVRRTADYGFGSSHGRLEMAVGRPLQMAVHQLVVGDHHVRDHANPACWESNDSWADISLISPTTRRAVDSRRLTRQPPRGAGQAPPAGETCMPTWLSGKPAAPRDSAQPSVVSRLAELAGSAGFAGDPVAVEFHEVVGGRDQAPFG